MFCGQEIKAIETKLLPNMQEATAAMDKARQWFGTDMFSQPAVTTKLLGTLDVRLVLFVHGIKINTRVSHSSIDDIGSQLAKEVHELGGDMSKCPWKLKYAPGPAAPAPVEKEEGPPNAILEYEADGSVCRKHLETVFGFGLGVTVRKKEHRNQKGNPAVVYHIAKIDGAAVTLIGMDANAGKVTTTVGELVDLYENFEFKQDLVVRTADFATFESDLRAAFDAMRSSVKLMLYDAARLHQPKVDLKLKGDGCVHVFAAADYKVGQLQLVPFTTQVAVVLEADAKKPERCVRFQIKGSHGAVYVAALHPMPTNKAKVNRDSLRPMGDMLFCPYWDLRSVPLHEENLVNMKKSTLKCALNILAGTEEAVRRVTVPILQNAKALKKGDELLMLAERVDAPAAQKLEASGNKRAADESARLHQPACKAARAKK